MRSGHKISCREQGAFDVLSWSSGGLHGDGQSLIHPWLGMTGGDRCGKQVDCAVESLLSPEVRRRGADAGEFGGKITNTVVKVARDGLPQIIRLDD